jgi:hypothetical protein
MNLICGKGTSLINNKCVPNIKEIMKDQGYITKCDDGATLKNGVCSPNITKCDEGATLKNGVCSPNVYCGDGTAQLNNKCLVSPSKTQINNFISCDPSASTDSCIEKSITLNYLPTKCVRRMTGSGNLMPPNYGYCYPQYNNIIPEGLCKTSDDCQYIYKTNTQPCGEMGSWGCNNANPPNKAHLNDTGNLGVCGCSH